MAWSFFGGNGRSEQRRPKQIRTRKSRGRRPLFEELEQRRVLAVLTVNTLTDVTAADGLVTLREAIIASNTDTATDLGDTGSGADTIQFAPGLNGTITLGGTQLTITDAVTINGPGATNLTINAAGASRIFNITDEVGDVTFKGLTLTGGNVAAGFGGGAINSFDFGTLTVADSVITGNAAGFGGGIYSYGDLVLTNTTVGGVGALGNTAVAGGGGIFVYDSNASVTLKNSTVSGNTAGVGFSGGGIFAYGTVSLENSTVGGPAGAGNKAGSYGGGIYSTSAVDLLNSTVAGNEATSADGGGIYASGNVTLKFSTVSGNTAGDDGGGIFSSQSVNLQNSTVGASPAGPGNTAADDGGGIYSRNVTVLSSTISGNQATGTNGNTGYGGGIYASNKVVLQNSTVSGNQAEDGGGGVYASNVSLQNSTVANNLADSTAGGTGIGGGIYATTVFTMRNSIVAGNTDSGNGNPDLAVPVGSKVKFSLIGDNTGVVGVGGAPAAPGSQNGSGNFIGTGATPITLAQAFGAGGGTLTDNGGPTQTIELKADSLVINKGKNSLVVSPNQGDQRGLPFVRIFGGKVDMGAFEFQIVPVNAAPVVANAIPDQTAFVGVPFVFTFAANAFTDPDGDPLTYTATLSPAGALPAWLTFTQGSNGRTFVGVPTAADIGPITVRVTASDGKGGTVFDDFVLTVASNPPPTLANAIPDQNATVSVPFNFTFAANTFTDPNGDPLTYSATLTGGGALPAWLSFNPATRTFTGTPAAGDIGTISVRVTAADGQGGTATDDFNIAVTNSELPFNENFEGTVDARIVEKSPAFTTTTTNPINGAASYVATRPTVNSRPVATVDFVNPATAANVTNVNVNVSTGGGNGSSLWSNAVIVFDYVSPTNYKFAGVFEIIDKLIIGQVVNGKVSYLAQKAFPALPNTTIPLSLSINRTTKLVTITSGATVVSRTFSNLGTGTVGVGTINANSRFDNLDIT